jgi:hypothetical protein
MKKIISWLKEQREWSWLAIALLFVWGLDKMVLWLTLHEPVEQFDGLINAMTPVIVFIVISFVIVRITPHNCTLLSAAEYKAASFPTKVLDICATALPYLFFLALVWLLR